jgi:putative peptidoglycan lipid II flippase
MAALNAHGSFAVPALSPLVFSLAIVLSIVIFGKRFGVLAMGVGVLVGGILQLAFITPAFLRKGYDLRLELRFADPDFLQTLKLWIPYLLSASIFTVNQLVAQYFASGLENGSVSAVWNSAMFLQIPIGIFTASVYTVLFPQMSRLAAVADRDGLRASVSHGLELLVTFLFPAAVLLCLFGREVISASLQRGLFMPENTLMASRALTGYAVGLVSVGLFNFLQRFFYSLKSFMVPLASALIVAVVDIAFSLILKQTRLRVAGLAYANSIAFTAGLAFLIVKARESLGSLASRRILAAAGKSLVASLPMAAFLIAFVWLKPDLWLNGGTIATIAWAGGAVLVSILLTLLMFLLLDVPVLKVFSRKGKSE